MRLSKKLTIYLLILLFCSAHLNFVSVSENTNSDIWVDCVFSISIINGTSLNVNVSMNLHKIELAFGKNREIYSADYIRELKFESENSEDDYEGTIGVIQYILRNVLYGENGLIDFVFKEAEINSTMKRPIVKITDVPSDDDPWNPPILFYDLYEVSLGNKFFNLSEEINSHDLVNGLLNSGAEISYELDLKAVPGWNVTYRIIPNQQIRITESNGSKIGDYVEWDLTNWNGTSDVFSKAIFSIEEKNIKKPDKENVFVKLEIDTQNINSTSLKASVSLKSVDMRKYDNLPDFVKNVTFLNADGVRLLVENQLMSWDEIKNITLQPIEENISKRLSSILNQSFDFETEIDDKTTTNCSQPYNLSNMNDYPPINFTMFDDNIEFYICNLRPKVLFGILNAGAVGTVPEKDFGDIGYPYEGFLYLPSNIVLDNQSIYKWDHTTSISGEIKSVNSKEYKKEKKDVEVLIDIKSADLKWDSIFGGKSSLNMISDVAYTFKLYVIKKPDALQLENIQLDYLCSDTLRLLIEEGIFSGELLNNFLNSMKAMCEENLSKLFNKTFKTDVNSNILERSLKWDEDINKMDSDLPINISFSGKYQKDLPINLSFVPPSVTLSDLSFNLSGLPNYNVSYKIVFPKGLSVKNKNGFSKGKTKDDREFVALSFKKGENLSGYPIKFRLKASPMFLFFALQPCWIVFTIVFLIIIILILARKKRKGKEAYPIRPPRKIEKKVEEEEEEGFYTPPEPPIED